MFRRVPLALVTACLVAGLLLLDEEAPQDEHRAAGARFSPETLSPASGAVLAVAPAVDSSTASGVDLGTPGKAANPAASGMTGNSEPSAVMHPGFLWAVADIEGNPDPGAREQALLLLQEVGTPLALVLIEAALQDPEPGVREAAIDALAEIGDETSSRALIHAYFSETEELREEIVHALAEIGDAAGTDFLLTASHDASAAVRSAALAYQ